MFEQLFRANLKLPSKITTAAFCTGAMKIEDQQATILTGLYGVGGGASSFQSRLKRRNDSCDRRTSLLHDHITIIHYVERESLNEKTRRKIYADYLMQKSVRDYNTQIKYKPGLLWICLI